MVVEKEDGHTIIGLREINIVREKVETSIIGQQTIGEREPGNCWRQVVVVVVVIVVTLHWANQTIAIEVEKATTCLSLLQLECCVVGTTFIQVSLLFCLIYTTFSASILITYSHTQVGWTNLMTRLHCVQRLFESTCNLGHRTCLDVHTHTATTTLPLTNWKFLLLSNLDVRTMDTVPLSR